MKTIFIFWLFLFALSAVVYSEQVSRIELNDGSVINGQIVSYINGVYTINTGTLGEIKIEAAKISKIETASASSSSTSVNPDAQIGNISKSQVDSYRQTIMSNPENASIVTGLATDPEIQELAKDPQIIDAAKTGDIQALMKNEKFMSIINSSKMKEAIKKLKQ
ncbi:MAG: hypothetical protein WCI77_07080 [Candidatus Omnitrophota bacterium]